MEKLKKLLVVFKRLLGLEKPPPPPPPPPTRLDVLKIDYDKTPEQDRLIFIQNALSASGKAVNDIATALQNQTQEVVLVTSPVYEKVRDGLQELEAQIYFIKEKNKAAPESDQATEEDLAALQNVSRLLRPLAILGKTFTVKLEEYLQKFEEPLRLAEARGEYKLKISENKEWVQLPLLQFLISKKTGTKIPESILLQFFYPFPELAVLELETAIPMLTTSLIEVEMMTESKRVTPVRVGDGWYLYITD